MNLNISEPGKGVSGNTVDVSESTFGRQFNEALVHQVVVSYLAGGRQGSRAQKTRSEVNGGVASHSVKKVLVALVRVLFALLCGEGAVKLSRLSLKILVRR